MTLALDFSQNKATAALLGTGFSSSGDAGNTDKKQVFAENLRQQISEAVSSINTNPTHSKLLPAEPLANNPVDVVSEQFMPLKLPPAITGNNLQDAEPEGIAAGGMFLPLSDQYLTSSNVEKLSDSSYGDDLPGDFSALSLELELELADLPSLFRLERASPIALDNTLLEIDTTPSPTDIFAFQALTEVKISAPDHAIVDQSLVWNVNADGEATTWQSLHKINPSEGNRAEFNVPGYAEDTLFNSAAVSQYLPAVDTPLQYFPVADSPLATPVILDDAAGSDATILDAADYIKGGDLVGLIPAINLTPAYDLSLPEVMPPITLSSLSNAPSQSPDLTLLKQAELAPGTLDSGQTANATPVLANVMPLTTEKISIDKTKSYKTEMSSTAAVFALDNKNPASRQPADNNAALPDIVVDLQSKGIEPASSSSTRSAYLNSLLANLPGTELSSPAMPGLSGDAYGQGNTLIAQNTMARTDAIFFQNNHVIPTKSVLNDQSLLASVSASSSDLSTSLQGASHYTADQRLLQAAESRFAHLQGIQQANVSVENALSRMPGTGLAGLDVTFGQTGWVERIGQQLLLQTAQGNSIARIRIDPPELGSLTIRIQLAEQTATVNFVSPHAMVRDAIEQQSQRLQEMFNEQGLNLRDVTVSDQSPNSRQQSEGQSAGHDSAHSQSADSEDQQQTSVLQKSASLIDYYA